MPSLMQLVDKLRLQGHPKKTGNPRNMQAGDTKTQGTDNKSDEFRSQNDKRKDNSRENNSSTANRFLKQPQTILDPLLASRIYNNTYCPIGRLPDELLLLILGEFEDDIVTIYCLRRVCEQFRHLLGALDIKKHEALWCGHRSVRERSWLLSEEAKDVIQQRIQRDGMCEKCKLWFHGPADEQLARDQKRNRWWMQRRWRNEREPLPCKFASRNQIELTCDLCGAIQGLRAFSILNRAERMVKGRQRQCLGCQGAVQLCEHVHLSWATIRDHITSYWQGQLCAKRLGTWQDCFDSFDFVCRHPSHDRRCLATEEPSWPRARLKSGDFGDNVDLRLEWQPHSGLDVFSGTADKQMLASELRTLFQSYKSTAEIICPSDQSSKSPPEMLCFPLATCRCVHYEGSEHTDGPAVCDVPAHDYTKRHVGENTYGITMNRHRPSGMQGTACLVTCYRRDMFVCKKADQYKINIPSTHEWFHNMDPDSYYLHVRAMPRCRKKGCMIYYRRPKTMFCPSGNSNQLV